MKVALVHEYLVQYGGAEKVLEALREIFPKAPIYTLLYDKKKMGEKFADAEIRTSFLQKIPFAKSHHRVVFPILMPVAIEQFDLSYYDLVISDSSSFAKGVITKPHTKHICYCHTPTRFAWDGCQRYIQEEISYPRLLKKIAPIGLNYVRVWDQAAAHRPDYFIANSNFVSKRIKKYYNRDSAVIYPPVDVLQIQKNLKPEKGDYFLIVSRLISSKHIELAIEEFNRNGLPLKIIGQGPLFKRLIKKAKPNVELLGFVSDEEKWNLISGCKAFLFLSEEDFGITPIEAMAAGKPVIALRAGGALETIIENKTGVFFNKPTSESLKDAINNFLKSEDHFNSQIIQEHARRFDKEVFKAQIMEHVTRNNFTAKNYLPS